jgi:drug/metabolite transporter (DMT)-like permease
VCGGQFRIPSPSGDSTLITSAPMSASSMPAKGPAAIWQSSMTRMPRKGEDTEDMEAKLSPRVGIVIMIGIAVLFGANHVAARMAFDAGASVSTAVLFRAAGTALFLAALMRYQRVRFDIPPELRTRAAVLGILMALQSYCLYTAVSLIPAALALLVFHTFPILFLLLSWAMRKEAPRIAALAPMLLALLGLALALDIRTDRMWPGWSDLGAGAGWSLAAAFAFALMLYGNAHWIPRLDGRLRTFVMTAVTAAIVLVAGISADAFSAPIATAGWAGLALLTLLYGCATICLFIALPRLSGAVTTMALNFEPIVVLALAWMFLGQTVSAAQAVGIFVVVAAITLLSLLKR